MTELQSKKPETRQRRDHVVAVVCFSVVAGMIGLSYAAVPLYRLFCQVTGYGGTPQIAAQPSSHAIDKSLTMRFDANVSTQLGGWSFKPEAVKVDVKFGENSLAYYVATNTTDKSLTGTAMFNVTPEIAGAYFNKIECFCFAEQTLKPGETVRMPVSFYVDPDMLKDPDAHHVRELTLSYTFYPSTPSEAKGPSASATQERAARQDDQENARWSKKGYATVKAEGGSVAVPLSSSPENGT